ncbi:hypothetical protein FACS189487_00130 [Campylobacterota bacterium]|nr:hypothetical protein FACS189487_00130 [Campylobacterota bacterium]
MHKVKLPFLLGAAFLLAACVQPYPAPRGAAATHAGTAQNSPNSQKESADLPQALSDYYDAARRSDTSVEVMERHNDNLSALIEGKKANANAEDSLGRSPLFVAVRANDNAMILRLCGAGADANANSINNLPLLTIALQEGALESAKALLACGANPNAAGSPLTIAVLGGITSEEYRLMAITLLDKGADPNRGAVGDHSLLIYAIKTAQSDLAVKMAASGATINLADDNGMAALSWAVLMRDDRAVDALLASGAAVDLADAYGYTPISWAILTDNNRAVAKIAGSNWQPRDDDRGVLAAEIAKTKSLAELRALLGSHASADFTPSAADTPNIIAFSDMPFLRIEYLENRIKFKTGDNLRKGYMLENPPRLVMDFDRVQGAFGRTVALQEGGAFLRVTTGKHDGFYRVVVQLNRQYGFDLNRDADGFVVKLK